MPTWPGLDRWLNFEAPPAFLVPVQPKERDWWRIVLSIGLLAPGTFLAFGIGMLVTILVGAFLLLGFGEATTYAQGFAAAAHLMGGMATAADDPSLLHESVRLLVLGFGFALWAGVLILIIALVNRRKVMTWITAAPRFRWKLVLAGLVLNAAVLGVWLLVAWLSGDNSVNPPMVRADQPLDVRLVYVALSLLCIPVAAAFEEVLCRGWMLQLTGAFTRNLIPILLVNGVIFSALHLDPDLGRNIARLASGLVFSWAVIRLGGLEFAIGAHTANNLMIGLFASTLTANLDITVKSEPWELAIELLASAVLLGLIELTARWTPLRRWTGANPEALPGQ